MSEIISKELFSDVLEFNFETLDFIRTSKDGKIDYRRVG